MTNLQATIEQVSRPSLTLFDLSSKLVRSSAVRSRLLRECYYQPETHTLAVHMRTGGWEVYDNIDESVYDEIVSHPHPGYLFDCLRQAEFGPPLSIFSPHRAVFIHSIKRRALSKAHATVARPYFEGVEAREV
jgi:hypothetical protein